MGTERTDVSVFETAYEILYIYDVVLRNPRLLQQPRLPERGGIAEQFSWIGCFSAVQT